MLSEKMGEIYDRAWMAKARILTGMNQREAAVACGISQGFYNRIESGYQLPNVKVGMTICKVLGVSPDNWVAETRIA